MSSKRERSCNVSSDNDDQPVRMSGILYVPEAKVLRRRVGSSMLTRPHSLFRGSEQLESPPLPATERGCAPAAHHNESAGAAGAQAQDEGSASSPRAALFKPTLQSFESDVESILMVESPVPTDNELALLLDIFERYDLQRPGDYPVPNWPDRSHLLPQSDSMSQSTPRSKKPKKSGEKKSDEKKKPAKVTQAMLRQRNMIHQGLFGGIRAAQIIGTPLQITSRVSVLHRLLTLCSDHVVFRAAQSVLCDDSAFMNDVKWSGHRCVAAWVCTETVRRFVAAGDGDPGTILSAKVKRFFDVLLCAPTISAATNTDAEALNSNDTTHATEDASNAHDGDESIQRCAAAVSAFTAEARALGWGV